MPNGDRDGATSADARPAVLVAAVIVSAVEAAMLLAASIGLALLALSVDAFGGVGASFRNDVDSTGLSDHQVSVDVAANLVAAALLLLATTLILRRMTIGLVVNALGLAVVVASYAVWCTRGQWLNGLAFVVVALLGVSLTAMPRSVRWLRHTGA